MKKVLLSLAALGTTLSANAQLLSYGFEVDDVLPGTTQVVSENWDKSEEAWATTYFNLLAEGMGVGGSNALYAIADKDGRGTWDRVIAFTNLGIQENKAYRVSMDLKGSGNLNVALLKGKFNADKALVAFNGENSYAEQTKNFAATSDFKKISYLVWSPSREVMVAQEAKLDTVWDQDFLRLSFNGAGEYVVDNVKVEEASICGVKANEQVIAIDFGFSTNAAALAAAEGGTKLLNKEDVTVIIDEEPAEVLSVELKSDGNMYIFLTSDFVIADEEQVATVSFTNNYDDFVYAVSGAGDRCPAIGQKVPSFENEAVTIDPELSAVSYLYEEANLVSSYPEDNSFGMEENITEFSFTFDRLVKKYSEENGAPIAKLTGKGVNETLVLTTTDELTKTLTYKLANAVALTKGTYSITLDYVSNEMDRANSNPYIVSFETGKVHVAKTTYTKLAEMFVPSGCGNGVPEGWEIMTNNELRLPGNTYGSGGRVMDRVYGSGVYFRAGDGEQAYCLTAPVTLPVAEKMQLRAYVSTWKPVSHKVTIQVLDADSAVVAEAKEVPTTAQNAEGGDANWEFQRVDIDMSIAKAGEYRILFIENTLDGQGLFVKGGEFVLVETSEGDSFTPETIAEGNFAGVNNDCMPAHGSGWKIYRADDRMRDPGANGSWGGNDWTGGGGPRVKSLGNKGMNGAGIYLGGGCYATYGEFEVQTDHNGPVLGEDEQTIPEKVLEVNKAKYQISYYIIGWKALKTTTKFEIFSFQGGYKGEAKPVYSRTDEVDAESGSGGNGSKEAKKIQFFWDAPAAGKYIIKVTSGGEGEGETVFGNMTIETTASLAIQYAQLMDKALEPAKEELALAMAKEEYRGATRDALAKIIEDNAEPRFNTVPQYEAEFAKIAALIKKSQLRRSNIDAYPNSIQAVKEGIDAATGTKFENLEVYPELVEAYETYKDVDYIALDDEALDTAVKAMGDKGTLLKNMVDTCVPMITKQINDLVAAINTLGEDSEPSECVLAAAEALTDDQELVAQLKAQYVAKLYSKLAAGQSIFNRIDSTAVTHNDTIGYDDVTEEPITKEVVDYYVYDTIDITVEANFLIQNPNFYCVGPAEIVSGNVKIQNDAFPGWTVNVLKGAISCSYNTQGWGGAYPTSTKPIEDCAARTGWGDNEFTVEQLIDNLPIVNYNVGLTIGEDGGSNHGSYAYCNEDTCKYEGKEDGSFSRDESEPRTFTKVTPAANEENTFASIKLGAYMTVTGGFINVDKATLTMAGPVKGFDYAAAAAKLNEVISGIQVVERTDAPVAISFFNLAGQQIATPQGVSIKIERYADGYTVVKKIMTK